MAGNRFWQSFHRNNYHYDITMKRGRKIYDIIRQIHLYSSLCTVALMLMYIVTSYMMMYHDWFKVERKNVSSISIKITSEEVADDNWKSFLKKNNIKGRLVRGNYDGSGDLIRTYSSANENSKITIYKDKNEVEIKSTQLNLFGNIIGLHRLRGYGGPILYNIYAFFLDIVGISLILFAVTGVILWLNLLKHNKIAWTILFLGFIYVSIVVSYLIFV